MDPEKSWKRGVRRRRPRLPLIIALCLTVAAGLVVTVGEVGALLSAAPELRCPLDPS
jgi:hypothetical protein